MNDFKLEILRKRVSDLPQRGRQPGLTDREKADILAEANML